MQTETQHKSELCEEKLFTVSLTPGQDRLFFHASLFLSYIICHIIFQINSLIAHKSTSKRLFLSVFFFPPKQGED